MSKTGFFFNSRNSRRAKAPLELVHFDLVGPMQTTFIGGSTYFMTLIDDFSHRAWVYFLKNKYEAFDKFVEFKALAEKNVDTMLKSLDQIEEGSIPPICL